MIRSASKAKHYYDTAKYFKSLSNEYHLIYRLKIGFIGTAFYLVEKFYWHDDSIGKLSKGHIYGEANLLIGQLYFISINTLYEWFNIVKIKHTV